MVDRQGIRTIVRGAYDMQKLRIQIGNRVCANFRSKLGQAPGKKASDVLDADAKKLIVDLKRRYARITDAIVDQPAGVAFVGDELIATFTEYALVESYIDLETAETRHFKRIDRMLPEIPIYENFLKDVRGIGPAMAGVLVAEIDISIAKYPSSLWAYAGLDTGPDGLGRSRREEHLVKRQYKNAKGENAERNSITYNPWLKTKLMGVLAPSFLKSQSDYVDHYKNYRHRIETNPNLIITDKPGFHTDNTWTKQRRHYAAMRYMIKMFLVDLYGKWRTIEGLPVSPTYHEAKHGHVHGEAA